MAGGNNAIGSGAVVLTTTADGLTAGLNKAHGELQHFGQSAGAGLTKQLAAGAESGGMLSKIIGGIKAHPFVTAGVAAGAALVEGFHLATDKLGELNKINKQAGVLGVKPSELQGFQMLLEKAGIEGEAAAGVFAKMGKNLVGALNDGGEKAAAFKKIGLDPHQLNALEYTEQFKLIADGLGKLPVGAAQATVAMDIFGKSGYELLPMLQRGSKGIEEWIHHAKASGAILTDEQFATAGRATKAWKEAKESISHAWEGLYNRMALAAAPVVKFVGEGISKAMVFLSPIFAWAGRGLERIGVIAGVAMEMISTGLEIAQGWMTKLAEATGTFGADWPTIQDVVTGAARAIVMGIALVWDTIKAGQAPMVMVWGKVIEGLGKVVNAFKDETRSVLEIAEKVGKFTLNPLMQFGARALLNDIDNMGDKLESTGKAMQQWGKDAWTNWGDGAKDAGAWFDRLLAKALKPKAIAELVKPPDAAAVAPDKFAGALERGSKEAYSIEMRARYGDFGKPENNVPKDQLKEQQKTNNILTDMMNHTGKFFDEAEWL